MELILASQSPQRRELFAQMGVAFTVVPSNFDEQLDNTRPPAEVAVELALGKAHEVARRYPDALAIGSDTITAVGDQQLGKPRTKAEAWRMWRQITTRPNKIVTSIALVCLARQIQEAAVDVAWVYLKPYDKLAIAEYINTGDYRTKAGAYGIQGGAAPLVDHITGHADTIVGLPTHLLAQMLRAHGIAAHAVETSLPVTSQ